MKMKLREVKLFAHVHTARIAVGASTGTPPHTLLFESSRYALSLLGKTQVSICFR